MAMASTIFIIISLFLTITAINTTPKLTTATTTGIHFPATLLHPISTTVKNSPLEFGFFKPISVSASVGAANWWGRMLLNLVLGLSSLHTALPFILNAIFSIHGGIVAHGEVLGMGKGKRKFGHVPLPQAKGKSKQKIEEVKDRKKDEERRGEGSGGDKGKGPEDGEDEPVDVTVEIRKYLNETDESIGVLIEEVPIDDCPSWTTLANRIHEVWKSIDREEDDLVEEKVDPSSCWPGYDVSYWSAEKKRINWNQVQWNHAILKLKLVRLVPISDDFF
ncbi:uncharacterized protein LOC141651089 [Silene latifolia]|uniref:uncharacterized protein LOC141651089 n=1 Tax=Silene latifolia TaxID=37657 RepID=UPI003D777404